MHKGLLRVLCSFSLFFFFISAPLSAQDAPDKAKTEEVVKQVKGDTAVEAAKAKETAKEKAEKTSKPEESKPGFIDHVNGFLIKFLFFDVSGGLIEVDNVDKEGNLVDPAKPTKKVGVPFIVIFLAIGAIFFTFFYRFINFSLLKHSVDVIRGKYDNPEDKGEISHFKALTSALSATIGLGNIAGVAFAIYQGGPGAVFWMMVIALFGMCAKFSSATLAQYFRRENKDGSISGGPMYYLEIGLKEKGKAWGAFGLVLAVIYALFIMGGSFGGGNMFQSNQALAAVSRSLTQLNIISVETATSGSFKLAFGLILAASVAVVILGGIKRIGNATSKIVPVMCGVYILASAYVILTNIDKLGSSIGLIFSSAFNPNAFFGGVIGVMIIGIKRAAFSNEAGLGSASIAHAAAKTDEPVREGVVAMIGPIIDTVIVCFMTSMVVIITGKWQINSAGADEVLQPGAIMTMDAFGSALPWFPFILTICILLFAYSTMISWCYYGERGWIYIVDKITDGHGIKTVVIFRMIFVMFVVLGAVNTSSSVLDFSDLMILSMAFPNILGSIFLAPFVWSKARDYIKRYKAGEFKTYN